MRFAMTGAVLLLFAAAVSGQAAPCDDALHKAQKTFELGLFEDVPEQLLPCTQTRLSRPLAIEVHSLLARAYVQMDDPSKARSEIATVLRLDSTFDPGPASPFATLVQEVRREEQTAQVASVSKTTESLREAPATVTVITGEEIQRRGYLDLEQLLHDLPGFDVSRVNGQIYSVFYQRGYNAYENDRDLLLVDGIEQNDIAFGTAYLSRQYPLTNIDRIEIIYGPAATMYGANAYTGVISIITKAPEAVLGERKSFGLTGQVTHGSHGGESIDVTAAGTESSGTIAWSIAAVLQQSHERDLSQFPQWDYTFSHYDYKHLFWMNLAGSPLERAYLCSTPSPYIRCDSAGIGLTDEGDAYVRAADAATAREQGVTFDDRAKNWSVYGKLRIANLTLGLQTWRSQEGTASEFFTGATNWTPKQTALYLKYSLPLSTVKLNLFTRYLQTGLDRANTQFFIFHSYALGFLSIASLVPPCLSPSDPLPVGCPAKPWVEKITHGNLSTQLRTEMNAVWEPTRDLNGVAGIELTTSSVEGGYERTAIAAGYPATLPYKPEIREHADYAAYAQGSWRVRPSLKLTAAGRLTYNRVDNRPDEHGFGTLFTPRAAVIYAPAAKPFVLKAIYSEAFKDPTDFQKYGVQLAFSNAYPSNGLKPEKVRNLEVNGAWEVSDRLSFEAAAYRARYTNVVGYGFARTPDGIPVSGCQFGCEQWQNRDTVRVRGVQLTGTWQAGRTSVWANYTHTNAAQVDPLDFIGNPLLDANGDRVRTLRSHGIAPNHANLGVTASGRRIEAGLRVNYVDRRPQGAGTTLPTNFTDYEFGAFGPVAGRTTADAVASYRASANSTVQLSVFNLLNREYSDPASDNSTQAAVPQARRTASIRLIYKIPAMHASN